MTTPRTRAASRPTVALIEELSEFLAARYREADQSAMTGLEIADINTGRQTARILYVDLATTAAGYVNGALEMRQWNENVRHRWWLLLSLAQMHRGHPDLPAGMRPFLDALI